MVAAYLAENSQRGIRTELKRKMDRLKQGGYLNVFLAEGEKGKFCIKERS